MQVMPIKDGLSRIPDRANIDSFANEPETKLLDEKRSDYFPHSKDGNWTIVSQMIPRRDWSPPLVVRQLGCIDLFDRSASCCPMILSNKSSMRCRNLFKALCLTDEISQSYFG